MKLWYGVAVVCGAVAASCAQAAVSVDLKGGHMACRATPGQARAKDDAVMSPDGHTVAYIRFVKSDDVPDGKAGVLWIGDCRTGATRRLLPAPFAGRGDTEGWATLGWPVFSLDGRQVYVGAYYGGDSGLVQRVDISSGRHAYVMAAELFGIIRNGPYRGDLLASQHTSLKNKDGGEYGGYPYSVFTPQGKIVTRLPGSETWGKRKLKAWLGKQGWQVR